MPVFTWFLCFISAFFTLASITYAQGTVERLSIKEKVKEPPSMTWSEQCTASIAKNWHPSNFNADLRVVVMIDGEGTPSRVSIITSNASQNQEKEAIEALMKTKFPKSAVSVSHPLLLMLNHRVAKKCLDLATSKQYDKNK